jgi:hypothetical protein
MTVLPTPDVRGRFGAGTGGILPRQVLGVINQVIDDAATDPDVRSGGVVRRMNENPDSPEEAMLAHLRDCHDVEDPPQP